MHATYCSDPAFSSWKDVTLRTAYIIIAAAAVQQLDSIAATAMAPGRLAKLVSCGCEIACSKGT